jgi:hypothetical protein
MRGRGGEAGILYDGGVGDADIVIARERGTGVDLGFLVLGMMVCIP